MYTLKNANIDSYLIYNSIMDAIHNKMTRDEVFEEISLHTDGLFSASELRQLYLSKGMEKLVPYIIDMAKDYLREIQCRCVTFSEIKYKLKRESNNKIRRIAIQSIKQLIFDYIAINAFFPVLYRCLGVHQCASIPGKGQIQAKDMVERWIQHDRKNTKYYIKTDIKQYFPSVNHDLLMDMIKLRVKDADLLYIIETILNTYEYGINIGSYLSQWLANYFICDVYREITENMHRVSHGKKRNMVSHAITYMDDMIIFCRTKKDRDRVYEKLKQLLAYKELKIHHTLCAKIVKGACIDAFGFKFYTDHTIVRKRIHKRIIKLKHKIYNDGITLHNAYKLVSYNGILVHSDSVKFIRQHNLKPYIDQARQKISEHDKRFMIQIREKQNSMHFA